MTVTLKEQHSYKPAYLWRNTVSILNNTLHKERLSKLNKQYFDVNDNSEVNVVSLWCGHKAYSKDLLIQAAAREKEAKGQNNYSSTH